MAVPTKSAHWASMRPRSCSSSNSPCSFLLICIPGLSDNAVGPLDDVFRDRNAQPPRSFQIGAETGFNNAGKRDRRGVLPHEHAGGDPTGIHAVIVKIAGKREERAVFHL